MSQWRSSTPSPVERSRSFLVRALYIHWRHFVVVAWESNERNPRSKQVLRGESERHNDAGRSPCSGNRYYWMGMWLSHAMATTSWRKVVATISIAREWRNGRGRTTSASPYQVDRRRVHLAGGSNVCSATGCQLLTWVSRGQRVLTHPPQKRQEKAKAITIFRRLAVLVIKLRGTVASAEVEATWTIPGKVSGRRMNLRNEGPTKRRVACLHRQRLKCLRGIKKIHVFLLHQTWRALVGHKLRKAKHSCSELRRGRVLCYHPWFSSRNEWWLKTSFRRLAAKPN